MSSSTKRKAASAITNDVEGPKRRLIEKSKPDEQKSEQDNENISTTASEAPATGNNAASRARERQERFKALQARAKQSADRNYKEAAAESQRLATDPSQLTSLQRKQAFASHNLLKADTAAAGEDFERKRAWDWTVEESEKWDKRMEKKEKHRQDVAFQDYRQDSRKVYKRQLRDLKPDLEGYEKEKTAAVERAAASGGLEIVETEDGELIALDKEGTFYSTANSVDFVENKPERAAVDKLVADLKKAEETRLRKRKERGRGDDEGDVTYINDKNKEFNKRLARAYNKVRAVHMLARDDTNDFYSILRISVTASNEELRYELQAATWNISSELKFLQSPSSPYNMVQDTDFISPIRTNDHSIPLLQALLAKPSMPCIPTTPFTSSSPIASTTA